MKFVWDDSIALSRVKRSIERMFKDPKNREPWSFSYCFKRVVRTAKQKALSMSQVDLSDHEDQAAPDEEPVEEPPRKRLLRSSTPDPSLPSTSASSSFIDNASEMWNTSSAPLEALDRSNHDMRGYSKVKGTLATHSMILGLLMRGHNSSNIHGFITRCCEVMAEWRDVEVMGRRTIDNKRSAFLKFRSSEFSL